MMKGTNNSSHLRPQTEFTKDQRRTSNGRGLTVSFAVLMLILLLLVRRVRNIHNGHAIVPLNELTENPDFAMSPEDLPWSNIVPSSSLLYSTCYGQLQCARLKVPMDWNRTGARDANVAIAIVKIPAKVHIADPRYGGAVIINPGGPGGSGVDKILRQGRIMQDAVDAGKEPAPFQKEGAGSKYYDIIGYDPRGVNHTTPGVECYPSSLQRLLWDLQSDTEGTLGSPGVTVDSRWARYESRSEACLRRAATTARDNIVFHMNGAPVARDMAEIVERHGEWRHAQLQAFLSNSRFNKPSGKELGFDVDDEDALLDRLGWKKGREEILYWGTSYGTQLGATLATFYPSRIRRMLLDSIVQSSVSVHGWWTANLQDTDKILAVFCNYCHFAGEKKCALYRNTPAAIREAFENAHAQLWKSPISVGATNDRGPDLISYSDLQYMFSRALYFPINAFAESAELVQDILIGNGSRFADWKALRMNTGFQATKRADYAASQACLKEGPYSPACQNVGVFRDEVSPAIYCLEGDSVDGVTKEEFADYWHILRGQSVLMGDIWAEIWLRCVGWKVKPTWGFQGPFTAETKHPILLVNNRLDPATPLKNAYAVAADFPGARTMVQNTIGHGILSSPSKCTESVVREYFQTGKLPTNGSMCEVDELPFDLHTTNSPLLQIQDMFGGH